MPQTKTLFSHYNVLYNSKADPWMDENSLDSFIQ